MLVIDVGYLALMSAMQPAFRQASVSGMARRRSSRTYRYSSKDNEGSTYEATDGTERGVAFSNSNDNAPYQKWLSHPETDAT